MATIDEFLEIATVEGVKNYILVRNDGEIVARDVEEAEALAALALRCGLGADRIGTARYRYLAFRRKGGEDLFIFPVGNYYLGVIKERNIDGARLVDGVQDFIKALPRKRSPVKSPAKTDS